MKWLVWKEYRVQRLVLIVGAVLVLAPYFVVFGLFRFTPAGGSMAAWCLGLLIAAAYSAAISQLTMALLGGNAIACERADRSAEFLAYLPVSRARILAGKLAVVLLAGASIWGPNLLVVWLTSAGLGDLVEKSYFIRLVWSVAAGTAATGLVFFCVGWFLSSMLESPTFAVCGGLLTPVLILTVIQLVRWVLETPEEVAKPWYLGTCLVLAPVCFVAGTWYYLRRVEP
jgi:ABC-type transport system involved in multi-copper enzyme maturation permease subunit